MRLVTRYEITTTTEISDEVEAKMKEYIQTQKKELRCDRYHEQLEKAYEVVCGAPDGSVLDWYIEP